MAGKVIGWIAKKILGIAGKNPEETLVGKVVTRLIPDKQGQERFFAELEKEYKEHEHEYEMEFMSVVKDAQTPYEFEPKISMFLKGSTRWIIALVMTFFYIYLRLTETVITEYDQYLIGGIWGFLFILRSVEKVTKRDRR